MPQRIQPSFHGFTAPKKAIEVLSRDETLRYLEAAKLSGFRDFLMVELALYTGLRCAELVGLNIEHVTGYGIVSRSITISASIAKGGKARAVPTHPQLREDLVNYLTWRSKLGWPHEEEHPLFISKKTGRRLSTRDFQRITRKIGVAALGKSVNPHVLRHTFATRLLENTNLRVVQMALGHESLQSTQVYVHPNTDDMSRAVDALHTPPAQTPESGGHSC